MSDPNAAKRAAAFAAADLVQTGTTIGLGSGSTFLFVLERLAARVAAGLEVRGVATSKATAEAAQQAGVPVVELDAVKDYTIAQNELLDEVNKRSGGYGLTVEGIASNELNLTAGFMMMFGNNLNVGVGASAPLLQKPDRTFDAQVGVRASYLFGRTAQARNPIYAISTY